jgi:uncharacterized cupredoxin-like copper-binding protein
MRLQYNRAPVRLVLALAVISCAGLSAAASVLLTAQTVQAGVAASEPATPLVVEVDATDFAVGVADSIEGGWVTVRLRNTGEEVHNVSIRKLNAGVTYEDVIPLVEQSATNELRNVMTNSSGVGHVGPGLTGETTLNLEPGDYLLVCPISSPDGVQHMANGMFKLLRVTAPADPPTPEPQAAATLTLSDFSFDLPATLATGATYRVVNKGPQIHELAPIRLAPGKTLDDAVTYITSGSPTKPAPFDELGGPAGAAAGTTVYWTMAFDPGQCVLVCNIPDPSSGKSHIQFGMVKSFSVY